MHPAIIELEKRQAKSAIPQVQSGDTVRVHQRIREGSKQRIQVFEGVVIRTHRMGSMSATLTVRRIASGVGVEKTYLLHSPNVDKVEVLRRGQVRRNFLSYLRARRGKSARLKETEFDRVAANAGNEVKPLAEDPLAVEASADDDADVTEIDVEENEDELNDAGSLDEVIKEENREAREDDAHSEDGGQDESVLEQEEAESKIDKPDANE
jgi:large subunit ribosomal protein L19